MHISVLLSFLLGIYVGGSAYNPGGFMCSLCLCTQRNLYCEKVSSKQINYTLNGKPLGFDKVYFRNVKWSINTTINCRTFLGASLLDFGQKPCVEIDKLWSGDDCDSFKKSTKIICEKSSSSTTTTSTSSTSTTFTSPEATKAQTSPTTVLPSTSNETNTTVTTSTSTHSPVPLPRSSSTSSTPNDNSTPFSFPSRTNLTFTLSVISFSIIMVCLVIFLFIVIYRKCRKCSVTVQQNINRDNVRYNRLNQSVECSPHSSRPRSATAARVLGAVENPLMRQPRGTEFLMAPIIATTGRHGQWPGSPPVVREESQVDRSEREDAQSSSTDSINSNCSFLSQSLVVKKELDKKKKFETGPFSIKKRGRNLV